jgi:phasin
MRRRRSGRASRAPRRPNIFTTPRVFAIVPQPARHHVRPAATADVVSPIWRSSAMTENYAAKPTTKPFTSAGPGFDRPGTEGPEAMRAAAEMGTAYAKDVFAKTQAAAQDSKKILEQTYATATKGASEFNLQLIEVVRTNTNAAFDFARALVAAKSPTEFFELSAAHARQQAAIFTEQSQQLATLAQKVATEAAAPLQTGVTSAFDKVR